MELASESQSAPDFQRGLLRRPSQNSSSSPSTPVVQAVDFCRSKPRLVELEQQLYSLANGSVNSHGVTETCLSLLNDYDNTKEVFNVFCSCSWMDRYKDPVISQLFYELVNIQQDRNADMLLLAELEMACEELLKVLTHLETPNTLQLNTISLLYNLSRLNGLPPSHLEAVQSYLEEIARALWPYSRPSAPDLWGSEAFCDAQCDVLKACGKFLEEKCPVNTERTFQMINGKLISGDTSQYARFRLLEIRELRSSGWKLSGATVNYYKTTYQKFRSQSRKDIANNNSRASSRNGFKRINSFGESKRQTDGKPITVLRISENELRKSCDNLQEPFVARDAVAEEQDHISSSSVDSTELPMQQSVSLNSGSASHVLQNLTEHITERASSPFSSDGSDDVFANTVAKDKVVPAMHRGDFKKPRRPFKSDSSVSSTSESPATREVLLSDSNVSSCTDESALASSQSTELTMSAVTKRALDQPNVTSETSSIKTTVGSADTDSNSKDIDEKDSGTKSTSENWRTRKIPSIDETPGGMNEGASQVTENWRERRPSVDLEEPRSNNSSNSPNENWRERKVASSPDFKSSASHRENWRSRKAMSVDETTRDVNSTSIGQSKRFSTGDIQLERQDSNEKGKRSPGGGFGLPKQASQDLQEASNESDEHHEASKSELVEVQLSEEESQGLRWWKLGEIQADTGCKIFHDRDKPAIVIKGDPQLCKVAKKRVYNVIAALQEEFGALVPLSDEILEHLQKDGCAMLAERLAVCTGAHVKMINDTQLFISGHRNCVNLAKAQLAKLKVMLKYTDDPDVIHVSESQQDGSEEENQRVERLFAALEGRPRSLSQTDRSSAAELKPREGSLSRDFLISCASNPLSQQRPTDLSLERTEDWVKAIVLVNGRRGEEVLLERKKGFGSPNVDSGTRRPSV